MRLSEAYKPLGIVAVVLFSAAFAAGLMTPASVLTWLSLALAVLLYFFLPGYTLLLHLGLDDVERVIFAFPAGAIMTSVLLYFFNLFGILLTTATVIIAIVIVTAIPLFFWARKGKKAVSHSFSAQ